LKAEPELFPRILIFVCGLIALTAAAYWPTSLSLLTTWVDVERETYLHGLVIAAMSFWMLFNRRQRMVAATPSCNRFGALILTVLSGCWLIAYQSNIQVAHQAILVAIFLAVIYATLGRSIAEVCTFPIGFLFIAVPVWQGINGVLQTVTVRVVHMLLRSVGISSDYSGALISLRAGDFEVTEGCTGLGFILIALAIAGFYGELVGATRKQRIGMTALAVGLSLVANWARVVIIVMAGHLTQMQSYLVTESHYWFGWVLFAGTMVMFLFIERNVGQFAHAPRNTVRSVGRPSLRRMGAFGIGLWLGPALAVWANHRGMATVPQYSLPALEQPWLGPTSADGTWRPIFQGVDQEQLGSYRRDDRTVDAYRAVYRMQRQGKKLIAWGNNPLGSEPVTLVRSATISFEGRPFVESVTEDEGQQRWLVWYSYRIGERSYAQPVSAQLAYGLASLLAPTPSSVLVFRTRCRQSDCADAHAALIDLVSAPMGHKFVNSIRSGLQRFILKCSTFARA